MGLLSFIYYKLKPLVEPDNVVNEEQFKNDALQRLTEFQARVTLEKSREPRDGARPGPYIQTSEIVMPEHRPTPEMPQIGDAFDPQVNVEGTPVDCPPAAAPVRMDVEVDYAATLTAFPGTCSFSTQPNLTDTVGGDLEYELVASDCQACLLTDTANIDYACAGTCPPEDGDYYIALYICLRWDGSNWWIDATATVQTGEDFGLCGFDNNLGTDNGAKLSFDPVSVDLGTGNPTGVHVVNLSDTTPTRTCDLTITLS